MTEQCDPRYDVAVIGYGPTGATAANLLGRLGLNVVVIERDSDIYGRARAISTDEEVDAYLAVDRAGGPPAAGHAPRPADRVRRRRRPAFHRPEDHPHGMAIRRSSSCISRRWIRYCATAFPGSRMSRCCWNTNVCEWRSGTTGSSCCWPTCAPIPSSALRASYVIAADGGSSPTRGQLGVGYTGRTYAERWVVIDTKVLRQWDAHDRLRFHCNPARPTVDCPTPLGHHRWEYPARAGEDTAKLVADEQVWQVLNAQGITDNEGRRFCARRGTAITSGSPTAGG